MENYFDPREYVRGLQNIFIHDSKKIGFLFGAGTSYAIKPNAIKSSRVPKIDEMTDIINKNIKQIKDGKEVHVYETAINDIVSDLKELKINPNIEEIFSNVIQKEKIIGKSTLSNLNKEGWGNLKKEIEDQIKKIVSVHKNKKEFVENLIHCDFSKWIKNIDRKYPIEIFTTNYDYLLEIGLEYNEQPYYDGFIGSYKPWFYSSSIERMEFLPDCTKLWKLHGSLGWDFDDKRIIRCLPEDSKIMIFPSIMKYDDSKKQPYVSFMDRLSKFIKQDDSILFICGYSFGDQHINNVILNGLEQSSTSHVVAFLYDKTFDEEAKSNIYNLRKKKEIKKLAENPKLSLYGMSDAIIGGKIGKWKLKDKVSDEDAILLDLFFEPDYPVEGYIPQFAFQQIRGCNTENSKKIWVELKDQDYLTEKGEKTKKYFSEKEDLKLKLKTPNDKLIKDVIDVLSNFNYWTGEGEFKLPDFGELVNFLNNLNSEDYIKKMSKETKQLKNV